MRRRSSRCGRPRSGSGAERETRADGGYLLTDVPAGPDSVRVTMIGYAPLTQVVTVVAGQTVDVDFALTSQAVNLAEMVVVGYGEQRQGNISGAVTNVTAEEFNTGRVVTPTELIQNKVAGVQVVENNEPGGRTSIRIRGPSSTTASNEPLYVVDGLPLGGEAGGVTAGRDPLNFLNPDDIASITVLRDAAAAAIYGTNAANGVVLITTKRGQQGKGRGPKVEYTGSVSASRVNRLPSMLNAEQFRAAVEQHAPANAGQLLNENTDWFGAIDRTGFGQEHNVACRAPARPMTIASRPTSSTRKASSTRTASGELAWERTTPSGWPMIASSCASTAGLTGGRQIHPPRGALQCGAIRPDAADPRPHYPDGLLRLAWTSSDIRGQSGCHPESCRGEGQDESRRRQYAGRVQPAVDQRAPGQRQPRLRRRQGRP